jgi:S-DNA-T family DNA segregation ATPase FtsK/SpoIIIE
VRKVAKKKKSKDNNSNGYSVELTGLILILIGIIGFGFGFVGSIIKKFAMFLTGTWWILVLFALIWLGIYMLYKRKMPKFTDQRFIGIILFILILLVASHFRFLELSDSPKEIISTTYNNYMERIHTIPDSNALNTSGTSSIIIGGGLIGACLATGLFSLFDRVGTIIILVVIAIFASVLTFNVNLSLIFSSIFKKFERKKREKQPKESRFNDDEDAVIINNDDEEQIPEIKNIKEAKKEVDVASKPEPMVISSIDEIKQMHHIDDVPQVIENHPAVESMNLEIDNAPQKFSENTSYRLPKFSEIFDPVKPTKQTDEHTKSGRIALENVLKDFGIAAKVVDIHIGPAVTQYEIKVPNGTKVSKLLNLNKEIALSMAAKDVRIEAPIPGKSTVGIEIPNPSIASVPLREVLESPANLKSTAALCIGLGKDIMGNAKVFDLTKAPHMLVAGSTGSGKSVCINGIIASILMRYKPNEVKLVLVDPKKVELSNYNGIPHLLCPVVCDPKKASLTLQKVVTEMDRRFQLFSDCSVKNIAGYNEMIEKENKNNPDNPKPKMPFIVTIIDELADLMLVASKEVEDSIARITQLARAAGIHLIVATQRPSTDVITGLIKNNIPSRVAFAVSSQIDSRTILDQSGAEKLLGRGDMLFFPMGESKPTRIQGAFINDEEIKRLIDFCCNQASVKYDDEFTNVAEANTSSGTGNNLVDSNDDEAYNDVVEFAVQTGKISASLIQRRFRWGYNRAARMIDLLEARGVVGPQNGSKPREVLIKLQNNESEE